MKNYTYEYGGGWDGAAAVVDEHHNKRGGGPSVAGANGKLARFGILFAVNGSRCFRDGHETFIPPTVPPPPPYSSNVVGVRV